MIPLSRRDTAGIFLSFSFLHPHSASTPEPLNLEEPKDTRIFLTMICIVLGAGCRCLAVFLFQRPSEIWPGEKEILIHLFWRGKSHQMLFFLSFTLHQKITKHRKSYFEFYKQWCNTGTPHQDESLKKSIITLHFSRFQPLQQMCSGMLLKCGTVLWISPLKPTSLIFFRKKKVQKQKMMGTKEIWNQWLDIWKEVKGQRSGRVSLCSPVFFSLPNCIPILGLQRLLIFPWKIYSLENLRKRR